MKNLILSCGTLAQVDDEDFIICSGYKWSKSGQYAHTYSKDGNVRLHRFIANRMGLPIHLQIDHEDRNGLNCQRHNLRASTRSQNQANSIGHGILGIKGVYWEPDRRKYHVKIKVNGKPIHLGRFDNVEDASAAYRAAALKSFGEFARTD